MKKILVVVDIQNDFVDGALGSAEAAAIVDKVVNKIKDFDGEIIVTYDTHSDNYMDTREGRYLPVPHCIKGTEGWQLNEKVQEALNSREYTKIYKPTFGATALVEKFDGCDQYQTDVTLIGLCTDICVVSNAMLLKAFYPEMNINVDADCCAGVTPESHEAALATMKSCQINII
ncbi:MAG: cysteine hydrolase [bacterium]|nr:cysteine hydrolase [bacterium]MDY4099268.1 isochorismatase family cysteine hydrolase [Lachnospiraceae bacterium]